MVLGLSQKFLVGLRVATTAIGLMSASMLALPVFAQQNVTAEEASIRVNIAGRQRMLSQRIAKAACLMSQDISAVESFDQLAQAYNLFIISDDALRNGNPTLGLQRESIAEVREALALVYPHWMEYRSALEAGIAGADFPPAQMEALDDTSLRVLLNMNLAVFQIAKSYGELFDDIPLLRNVTVDVAGRQRMLTQRAVKEACMMRLAADPAIQARRLSETVQLFDLSLTALQLGYDQLGVIPAPTPEIANELEAVRSLWSPIKALLDRAVAGEILDDAALEQLARESEPLLWKMDAVVGLYEAIPPE